MKIKCLRCEGSKMVIESPINSNVRTQRYCPDCKGTGKIEFKRDTKFPKVKLEEK